MLIVVLALVIVALALLVVSLVIGQSLLAWLSIGVSVLAAIALVVDVLRRRKRAKAEPREPLAEPDAEAGGSDVAEPVREQSDTSEGQGEQTAVLAKTAEPVVSVDTETPEADSAGAPVATSSGEFDEDEFDDVEPGEEETDAADLLVVSELDDIVLVIDERPRYHLPACRWVGSRATISLPVRESRDLGFTPCGVCKPDSALSAKSRGKRGTRKPG